MGFGLLLAAALFFATDYVVMRLWEFGVTLADQHELARSAFTLPFNIPFNLPFHRLLTSLDKSTATRKAKVIEQGAIHGRRIIGITVQTGIAGH